MCAHVRFTAQLQRTFHGYAWFQGLNQHFPISKEATAQRRPQITKPFASCSLSTAQGASREREMDPRGVARCKGLLGPPTALLEASCPGRHRMTLPGLPCPWWSQRSNRACFLWP